MRHSSQGPLNQVERRNDDVDEFDPQKWQHDSAESINYEIALQDGECADWFISHPPQSQRDEGNNNKRIKNDGAENGAGWTLQPHDVERRYRWERRHEHCWD